MAETGTEGPERSRVSVPRGARRAGSLLEWPGVAKAAFIVALPTPVFALSYVRLGRSDRNALARAVYLAPDDRRPALGVRALHGRRGDDRDPRLAPASSAARAPRLHRHDAPRILHLRRVRELRRRTLHDARARCLPLGVDRRAAPVRLEDCVLHVVHRRCRAGHRRGPRRPRDPSLWAVLPGAGVLRERPVPDLAPHLGLALVRAARVAADVHPRRRRTLAEGRRGGSSPRPIRWAHRRRESSLLPRDARARDRANAAVRLERRVHHPRPRLLQAGQRRARTPGRRRGPRARGKCALGLGRSSHRRRGPLRWRRVRDVPSRDRSPGGARRRRACTPRDRRRTPSSSRTASGSE